MMYVLKYISYDSYDPCLSEVKIIACSADKSCLERHADKISVSSREYDAALGKFNRKARELVLSYCKSNVDALICQWWDEATYLANNFFWFSGKEYHVEQLKTFINFKKLKSPLPVIGEPPLQPTPYYKNPSAGEGLSIDEVEVI